MSRGKGSGFLAMIVVVGGFLLYNYFSSQSRSGSGSTDTSRLVLTTRPTSVPTATPRPVSAYNGQVFLHSDYEGVCNLTIEASLYSNHYIYLEYKQAPSSSTTKRRVKSSASRPYEDDLAFYVKAGDKATVQVPIGVYKLYYASGSTFFGDKLLFGDTTSYYSSDDYLTFYSDDKYFHGHTVTLQTVVNGNFDTDPIPKSQFPGR